MQDKIQYNQMLLNMTQYDTVQIQIQIQMHIQHNHNTNANPIQYECK